MNEIKGMQLLYRTLAPVKNPEDYYLSVGTISFLVPDCKELCLDFYTTLSSSMPEADGTIRLDVYLEDFAPEVFVEDYRKAGLSVKNLNYEFFRSRWKDTFLTEVYTEFATCREDILMPLTLLKAELIFVDGQCLDYSSHISVFALDALAEVA